MNNLEFIQSKALKDHISIYQRKKIYNHKIIFLLKNLSLELINGKTIKPIDWLIIWQLNIDILVAIIPSSVLNYNKYKLIHTFFGSVFVPNSQSIFIYLIKKS